MSKKQKIIEIWEYFLWTVRKRKLERLDSFRFRTGRDDQGRVFVELFTPNSIIIKLNGERVAFETQHPQHVKRLASTFINAADALAETGRRLDGPIRTHEE